MMEDLYPKMICRIQPWPEPVTRAFRLANQKIYVQMQGKSEFLVTGNLKDWERWDRLHEIKVRALTIGAQLRRDGSRGHEEDGHPDAQRHLRHLPQRQPHGFWDDQEFYFHHLLGLSAQRLRGVHWSQ